MRCWMILKNKKNKERSYLSSLKNYAGFGFLPAIRAGFIDGLNLGGLTAIIVFLMFAYFILRRKLNLALYSFYFIFSVIASITLITLGTVDSFLLHSSYDIILEVGYFIVIMASLIFGCVFFLDWLRLRKNEGKVERLKVSFDFLVDQTKLPPKREFKQSIFVFGAGIFSICLGTLTAILSSRWPCSRHVYNMYWELTFPGKYWQGIGFFIAYGLAYCFPLIILVALFLIFMNSKKMMREIYSSLSLLQIIISAVFLGYSLSLLSIYYINFQ